MQKRANFIFRAFCLEQKLVHPVFTSKWKLASSLAIKVAYTLRERVAIKIKKCPEKQATRTATTAVAFQIFLGEKC